ncbi:MULTISPECIES: hypothetical protein [unclassified Duganella]|uniref:hypothetical protein n=1 Tax=unclassified Duganella TaxID=2636909 RepID=UPI0011C1886A|nr:MULTISPECIES: hypothetical protein [unclassified Duganella]
MRINENDFVRVVLALGAIGLASVALTAYTSQCMEYEQQMELVRHFYIDYLSVPEGLQRSSASTFYSHELIQLKTARRQLCEKLSRHGDSCDYEHGEALIAAPKVSSGFTFDKAGLMAIHSGNNAVDVLLQPRSENENTNHIGLRYLLVKQADGWRVDNVLYRKWGVFSADSNMRREIKRQNENMLKRATPRVEGKVVALDALSYTFQDQGWITKIDLSKAALSKARHENQ